MNRAKLEEKIKRVKTLLRELRRGFGKPCKELHAECAGCRGNILIGYLNWYLDLLEWELNPPKYLAPKDNIK